MIARPAPVSTGPIGSAAIKSGDLGVDDASPVCKQQASKSPPGGFARIGRELEDVQLCRCSQVLFDEIRTRIEPFDRCRGTRLPICRFGLGMKPHKFVQRSRSGHTNTLAKLLQAPSGTVLRGLGEPRELAPSTSFRQQCAVGRMAWRRRRQRDEQAVSERLHARTIFDGQARAIARGRSLAKPTRGLDSAWETQRFGFASSTLSVRPVHSGPAGSSHRQHVWATGASGQVFQQHFDMPSRQRVEVRR